MVVIRYLCLFLLNYLIERSVAFVLGFRGRRVSLILLLVNLVTYPLLCYFLWLNSMIEFINIYCSLILLEGLVFIAETVLYKIVLGITSRRALVLGFLTNGVSFAVGLLLYWV